MITSEQEENSHQSHGPLGALLLGALGIVYGDIGTSPLYAMRECFYGEFGVEPNHENVLGVLSLIIWSLIITVSIKYVAFVLRADNKGEGGILALLALLHPRGSLLPKRIRDIVLLVGIFGAALLYGDGVITPAISVLSAVEGLNVATPIFQPFIIPLTVVILFVLFFFQNRGTGSIGAIFGPIILIWFFTLAVLGVSEIIKVPQIFAAFNPLYAMSWIYSQGFRSFEVLGAVFLCCTGAEALYADMGHFGKRAIRIGWFLVVFPCLILNYLGQGALLLTSEPGTVTNPFFQLAPSWAILPLVVLSTLAAVIASQALISGAFSLTMQAVQLGYLPRVRIRHTSSRQYGQIFVPIVNWTLLLMTVVLVISFRTSSNLAATYGTAVSLTMLHTTFLMYFAARFVFRWNSLLCLIVTAFFGFIDLQFFLANSVKFIDGGWLPLLLGAAIFTIMSTWWRGREILAARLEETAVPLEEFIAKLREEQVPRVPGTAIFMSRDTKRTPMALVHNLRHNRVVHETVLFLQVLTEDIPIVPEERRIETQAIQGGFHRIRLRYGFMEEPHVPGALIQCRAMGTVFDLSRVTFFLGRELVLPTKHPGMALWREQLFAFITSIATRATAYFQIPAEQVIEIGYQVEI